MVDVVYCLKLTSGLFGVHRDAGGVQTTRRTMALSQSFLGALVAAASAHVWTCVVGTAHRESDGSTLATCWSPSAPVLCSRCGDALTTSSSLQSAIGRVRGTELIQRGPAPWLQLGELVLLRRRKLCWTYL